MDNAVIVINLENDAFEDGCDGYMELARILIKLGKELQENGTEKKILYDINGNQAGTFQMHETD